MDDEFEISSSYMMRYFLQPIWPILSIKFQHIFYFFCWKNPIVHKIHWLHMVYDCTPLWRRKRLIQLYSYHHISKTSFFKLLQLNKLTFHDPDPTLNMFWLLFLALSSWWLPRRSTMQMANTSHSTSTWLDANIWQKKIKKKSH